MESNFLVHCVNSNLEGVNECLSRGVDVNTKDGYGSTALMFVCRRGNSAIVSRLVQVPGLDINYQDRTGYTAAHLASMEGHTQCVRILAETGRVDWNKRNNFGRTSLFWERKFDRRGGTPLYWALVGRHSDIVEIIVGQPNIDYNLQSGCGHTLAQAAVWSGDLKCVETLAAQERVHCWNVPNRRGNTPIMWALKVDQTEIVEILLRCPRVDLSCRDNKGWSLVFRAIQRNKLGEKMFGSENLKISVYL